MLTTYEKRRYSTPFGYRVNYTRGLSASDSTMDHLHCTTEYMLFYFMHGHGRIRVEGKSYQIKPGDIILLDPSELFHCTVDDGVFHERIVLHLEHSLPNMLPGDTTFLWAPFSGREKGVGNRIPAETVVACGLDAVLRTIWENVRRPEPADGMLAFCKVIELLIGLTRCTGDGDTPSGESSLIDEVLTYLNEHFTEDLTVSDIATRFFVDPSYLAHLFKEYTGMPLWTYVILRRLHRFNELLQQGCAAEAASRRVGFRNYSNFFRLYKKYRGMTPTEYKQQLRARGEAPAQRS